MLKRATFITIVALMGCEMDPVAATVRPEILGGAAAAYGDDTTKLVVSLSGPGWFDAPGNHNFTVSVSNGNGTYKYFWKSRWCTTSPKECEDDYWSFSASDSLSSTVSYYVTQYDFKNWIVVQVQETSGNGRSGADSIQVWGPAEPPVPAPSGVTMTCSVGSLGWPLGDGQGSFRRNPCTGEKVPKP